MEERIAEIVIRGFKHKQEDCETCKELWVCSTVVEKCTKDRILALIAADRAVKDEALKLARKHIGHLLQNPDKYKKTGETHSVLAKIASALKEMGK